MSNFTSKKLFCVNLEPLLKSGYYLNLNCIESKTDDLYKNTSKMKVNIRMLGMKSRVKLSEKTSVETPYNGPNIISRIKNHFESIYLEITYMKQNLDKLFQY